MRKVYLVTIAVFIALALVLSQVTNVLANWECHFDSHTNKVVCTDSGGNGGTATPGNGANPTPGGGGDTPSCNISGEIPGKAVNPESTVGTGPMTFLGVYYPKLPNGQMYCSVMAAAFDHCGNFLHWGTGRIPLAAAPCNSTNPPNPISNNPCKVLSYGNGRITCNWNFQWDLSAAVSMPPIVIDARPYPVALVNWPTTFRVNGLSENSGNGTLAYAGWGGGNPGNSRPGDWRNITLTLTFRPTGNPVVVNMALIPSFTVPSTGSTKTFEWQVASHPAVGANNTAGGVGQLGEIPSDMTLFQGSSMTTYRLYYSLKYDEYSEHYECLDSATPVSNVPPAIPPGSYLCKNQRLVGTWNGKSERGELQPNEVVNLPASMNGGSVYNDWTVVMRRMDENGNVNNPAYAHQYSWGTIFYIGVREGQGQIGWPDVP